MLGSQWWTNIPKVFICTLIREFWGLELWLGRIISGQKGHHSSANTCLQPLLYGQLKYVQDSHLIELFWNTIPQEAFIFLQVVKLPLLGSYKDRFVVIMLSLCAAFQSEFSPLNGSITEQHITANAYLFASIIVIIKRRGYTEIFASCMHICYQKGPLT